MLNLRHGQGRRLLKSAALGWFLLTTALAQNHFNPVTPTGLPYHIIITQIQIDQSPPDVPFEVGIFDDTLCVGAVQISNPSYPLDVVVWQADASYDLPGFTAGDSIRAKLWTQRYGEWLELTPTLEIQTGDGTFGYGSYTALALTLDIGLFPELTPIPDQLDFGVVLTGNSAAREVALTNTGPVRLTVTSLATDVGVFSVNQGAFVLQPGDTQRVTVTFQPDEALLFTGHLLVYSDDPNSPTSIALQGQGISPGAPAITVQPSTLDFGLVSVGDSLSQIMVITNSGTDTLRINQINLNNQNFYLQSPAPVSLPPGDQMQLEILFKPLVAGNQTGQLQIYSNATNSPVTQVNLSGYGYAGAFHPVAPTGLPYYVVINSLQIDGQSPVSGTEMAVFADTLCVGVGIFTGTFPCQITCWQGDPDRDLPGFLTGDSLQIQVHFTAYGSTLTLPAGVDLIQGDGTLGSGAYTIVNLVIDSGIYPVIQVAPPALSFNTVPVNTSQSLSFFVYNRGQSPLSITSISSNDSHFWTNTTYGLISPGDSMEIQVFFQPEATVFY